MKIPIFPGKYHQNGGFSWAMLVYRRVIFDNYFEAKITYSNYSSIPFSLGVNFRKFFSTGEKKTDGT